ncbi:hypothetical protein GGF45_003580, partial [Coemansia sp. RSA 551]
MSRAFRLGLAWLRTSRQSVSIYCVGAIAGVTVYYLYNDQRIASRRQQLIKRRKELQLDTTKSHEQYRFSSLNIGGRFVNPFDTWRDKTLWDFVRWLCTRTSGNGLPKDMDELDRTLPVVTPHFALLNALSRSANVRPHGGAGDSVEYAEYPDPSELDPRSTVTATWLGQSTCFVQMDGLNILTDPIFKRRTVFSWLGPERLRPVPCQLEDLPRPDIVLVSHNHFDHLDSDVVRQLGNTVT